MQIKTSSDLEKLKSKARGGDPEAEWEIGSYYYDGLEDNYGGCLLKKDIKKAVHWLRLSANHGNPSAQNHLGICLSNGEGVEKNEIEALYWTKKALKNGSVCAANNIATIYRDMGNNRRAFFWYRRAAESGDYDAYVEIGERYYKGTGVRKNYVAAVECYKKAIRATCICEDSREKAFFLLGTAFYEGKGVNHSLKKAKHFFQKANRDNDCPEAIIMLEQIKIIEKNISDKNV